MLRLDFTHFEKWGITVVCSAFFLLCSFSVWASARETPATFATPNEAVQAVIQAAETNDTPAFLQLFGSSAKDVVESGNPAEDKAARAEFVRKAYEKVEVRTDRVDPDKASVFLGSDGWPFPIPLVRISGMWRFDLAQGRLAILAHRIGENELDVIDVCRGFVEAELDYASESHDGTGALDYTQTLIPDLFPEALREATAPTAGGKAGAPYHGYYFRILKSQGSHARGGSFDYVVNGSMIGGFALVAWPAEYGVSGIKTFIVNHDGVVHEKDLGTNTADMAGRIVRFDPDESWLVVKE
jgi:hypothetical protein